VIYSIILFIVNIILLIDDNPLQMSKICINYVNYVKNQFCIDSYNHGRPVRAPFDTLVNADNACKVPILR